MIYECPEKLNFRVHKFLEFEKQLRNGHFGDKNRLDLHEEIVNFIIQNKCTCIYVDMKDISSIFVKKNKTHILSLLERYFMGTQYICEKIIIHNLSWFFDCSSLDSILSDTYRSKIYIQPGNNPIAHPYNKYCVYASQDTDILYSCR